MTGEIVTKAYDEWARRPDDERFADLASMSAFVRSVRESSEELPAFERRTMRVDVDPDGKGINWAGCRFSNWSFSQVCQLAKAPASYLATLPAANAAADLNYGIEQISRYNEAGKPNMVAPLVRQLPDGSLKLRAATTDVYRRVWNTDLCAAFERLEGRGWVVPPAWGGEPAGLYASDRDCFGFYVEDGSRSIVTHPQASKSSEVSRFIIAWNSEEGNKRFGMMVGYFDYVCGNHLLWNCSGVREVALRHVGAIRARIHEVERKTLALAARDQSNDLDGMRHAMTDKLLDGYFPGDTKLIEELSPVYVRESGGKLGKRVAAAGIRAALTDGYDPQTRWGAVYGLTALARGSSKADARVELERAAVTLMPKPSKSGGGVVWAAA